jgi:integrase
MVQRHYEFVLVAGTNSKNHDKLINYTVRVALNPTPKKGCDGFQKVYNTLQQQTILRGQSLALSPKSPSRSSFKHAIYGLSYYYRHIGQTKRAINLPSLKKEAKLPVILNREELRRLFKAPTLLKHRIALALIYSVCLKLGFEWNPNNGGNCIEKRQVTGCSAT